MNLSRRQFLAGGLAAATGFALHDLVAAEAGDSFSFFAISDTHVLANDWNTTKVADDSAAVFEKAIELLNTLPASDLPDGTKLPTPIGVIHCGDLIDSGDKNGAKFDTMQQTELVGFESAFGLTGKEGKLKYPIMELHGNHDSPQGKGPAIPFIIERNKKRGGLANVSGNGLHYSWDWKHVHFIHLGMIVGGDRKIARARRFNSMESLDFLTADLARLKDEQRPVIISHHVDIAGYLTDCDKENVPARGYWDACDVQAFYNAIRPYNVVAILYGHTHGRRVFKWDGAAANAKAGIDVFNIDDLSHFKGGAHGFFHFTLTKKELIARAYATKDHWETHGWTKDVWRKGLERA